MQLLYTHGLILSLFCILSSIQAMRVVSTAHSWLDMCGGSSRETAITTKMIPLAYGRGINSMNVLEDTLEERIESIEWSSPKVLDKHSNLKVTSDGVQVGGHLGTLKILDDTTLAKVCDKREGELDFYDTVFSNPLHEPLRPYLPRYFGKLFMTSNEKLIMSPEQMNEYQGDKKKLLECVHFENALLPFKYPCVMDLKIGTRQYGVNTSFPVRTTMKMMSRFTTSGTLGLRIVGYKTKHPPSSTCSSRKKEWGFFLSRAKFCDGLLSFFRNADGLVAHPVVLQVLKTKLEQLYAVLKNQSLRLYDSSLLIMFDGDSAWSTKDPSQHSIHADVRLIDFANAHIQAGEGPDNGALLGIQNVISALQEIIPQMYHLKAACERIQNKKKWIKCMSNIHCTL